MTAFQPPRVSPVKGSSQVSHETTPPHLRIAQIMNSTGRGKLRRPEGEVRA